MYVHQYHDSFKMNNWLSVCFIDNVSWTGSDLTKRFLYEHLVNIAGTEKDKRKRQQLFITEDMIQNAILPEITQTLSGSLAEGLDLPGSDMI